MAARAASSMEIIGCDEEAKVASPYNTFLSLIVVRLQREGNDSDVVSSSFQIDVRNGATGAVVGGVASAVLLLFDAPAIALTWVPKEETSRSFV